MTIYSKEIGILSTNDKHKIRIFLDSSFLTVKLADFAETHGVSVLTARRWSRGQQSPPLAVLRYSAVVYFGVFPWPKWSQFRIVDGISSENTRGWLLTHDQIKRSWTPAQLIGTCYGLDSAVALQDEIRTLQATVTALSTRQPPPRPCAEIIPFEPYLNRSHSNE